jgi:hypothetical protein
MKPYLYILAVLLVGGGIGYYIGQRSAEWEKASSVAGPSGGDDLQIIKSILERQTEAYDLHDAMLLLRDCAPSYVEINGDTGEAFSLTRAQLFYYDLFHPGKSVTLNLKNPDIRISRNLATVRAGYSKTSEAYEREGIKGKTGEGLWLLSKNNGRWQIVSFAWIEEAKE